MAVFGFMFKDECMAIHLFGREIDAQDRWLICSPRAWLFCFNGAIVMHLLTATGNRPSLFKGIRPSKSGLNGRTPKAGITQWIT
jgi:hypothetical protein